MTKNGKCENEEGNKLVNKYIYKLMYETMGRDESDHSYGPDIYSKVGVEPPSVLKYIMCLSLIIL